MAGDPSDRLVTDETRAEEAREAYQPKDAGRPPTDAEAEAAERAEASGAADGVEEPYREMTEKGADAKGEGRVP